MPAKGQKLRTLDALEYERQADGAWAIPLTRGKVTFVDDADFGDVSRFLWSFTNFGYAVRWVGRQSFFMHREILCPPAGLFTDHIDGDKLNNRRANLRAASHGENCRNRGDVAGISFHRASGKWRAYIRLDYRQIELGLFETAEEARRARLSAEPVYFGAFAPCLSRSPSATAI